MGTEVLKETPDFTRGDGTFFFMGDRMVVPITSTDVERYNLKNPYQDRGGESPDILGMSGMVMTPNDIKRCHARWVKAGAPTPRFFSNVLKCVLSLEEGWKKLQKSDYSTIDNLTNEKSDLGKVTG